MYFREKTSSNGTRLLQLVRGSRCLDGKVRQQVLLSLGGCAIPDVLRREIARNVEAIVSGQQMLMPPTKPEAAFWSDLIIDRMKSEGKLDLVRNSVTRNVPPGAVADGVLLDAVSHGDTRQIGVLLPIKLARESLGLSDFPARKGIPARRIHAAQACVFNRLVEPCGENGIPSWLETVAMDELPDEKLGLFGKEIFCRAGDDLLGHGVEIARHLRAREENLFSLGNAIFLYDLANSYFEGRCAENPKARRSASSKEKRTDCPLLALGLVINAEGFPIVHKVFPGNTSDSKTIPDIVSSLRREAGDTRRPAVVLDGGIATQANLKILLENNYDYIVNGKRTARRNFAEDFKRREAFRAVGGRDDRKPVFVKRLWSEQEVVLLCRSEDRKAKEDAIVSKTEERYLEALRKLAGRIEKKDGRLHLDDKSGRTNVERHVGKLASQYSRASKFYAVKYDEDRQVLSRARNEEKYREDASLHGCHHPRTSRRDLSDDEIWLVYIMLTRVETAFHLLKGELGLRPFYHWKEDRCDAHVWITVLAYHLLRWIEYSLELAGVDCTHQEVRRLLQTHCCTTISLPCGNGREYHVRRPGKPDERQKMIYSALGIGVGALPVRKVVVEPSPAGET
jgi:hypothetical protein